MDCIKCPDWELIEFLVITVIFSFFLQRGLKPFNENRKYFTNQFDVD